MPTIIKATLGANTFEATEVDAETIGDIKEIFRTWVNAQAEGAVKIEQLTDRLRENQDALDDVVRQHTPSQE